jgi:hypothetical protein
VYALSKSLIKRHDSGREPGTKRQWKRARSYTVTTWTTTLETPAAPLARLKLIDHVKTISIPA